jgi:hypothetical protein
MSEAPITDEFKSIVATIATELNVTSDKHGDIANRLAVDLPFFAKWSPGMTPKDEVKQRIADLVAQDLSTSLEAAKAKSPETSDGKMCGYSREVWDRLSPQNRMALFRDWQAKNPGAGVPPSDEEGKGRVPNIKRLESELRAAYVVSRTLRGDEKVKQTQRIADLEKQLKDARNG